MEQRGLRAETGGYKEDVNFFIKVNIVLVAQKTLSVNLCKNLDGTPNTVNQFFNLPKFTGNFNA